MAVYCEMEEVVQHLRFKTQSFYEALKRDAIAEQLYSQEGDVEAYFSRSLDKEPPMFTPNPPAPANGASSNKGESGMSPTKKKSQTTQIRQFEKCTDAAHMYQFVKEERKNKENKENKENKDTNNNTTNNNTNNKPISNLSRLIKPHDSDKIRGEEEEVIVPPDKPGMMLTIHTWQGPVTIKVIEKASVGQVISIVLKLCQRKDPATNMEVKHYLLRIADKSGTPDEDYPALDEKQLINKFRGEDFVICKNPKVAVVRTIPPQERATVIKVNFPDHSSTKIIVNPDLKIGELLKTVARKRQYNESDHFLRLPYAETPCDVNMTMEKLDANELTLSHKSMLQPDEETSSSTNTVKRGPLIEEIKKATHRKSTNAAPPAPHIVEEEDEKAIIWPDALFKSYEVIKIKNLRYGKKETTLGIDRDRIAHMSQQKRDSTKSKTRMIRDVVRVAMLDRPRQFALEYSDGKCYTYESKDAREIVAKIKYLVNTEQNIHNT